MRALNSSHSRLHEMRLRDHLPCKPEQQRKQIHALLAEGGMGSQDVCEEDQKP